MFDHIFGYEWSSLDEYVGQEVRSVCHTSLIQSLLNAKEYREFVSDEADYARSLADIKHLLIDMDD